MQNGSAKNREKPPKTSKRKRPLVREAKEEQAERVAESPAPQSEDEYQSQSILQLRPGRVAREPPPAAPPRSSTQAAPKKKRKRKAAPNGQSSGTKKAKIPHVDENSGTPKPGAESSNICEVDSEGYVNGTDVVDDSNEDNVGNGDLMDPQLSDSPPEESRTSPDEPEPPSRQQEKKTEAPTRAMSAVEPNCVEIRSTKLRNGEIAVLKLKKAGIALTGAGWMRVLRGRAHVLGASLTVASRSIYIVSAPTAPFAVTVVPATQPKDPSKRTEQQFSADYEDWFLAMFTNEVCKDGGSPLPPPSGERDECIVLFGESSVSKNIPGKYRQQLEHDPWNPDFPESCSFYVKRAGLPCSPARQAIVPGLSTLDATAKIPRFSLWKGWDRITASLCYQMRSMRCASSVRLLVCGASGTGKSMFARCIVNFLLCNNPQVLFIDTDVGQSEMSPPGLVAAYAVKRMRAGAPAASNRGVPIAARYFGDITPRENPDMYARHVEAVIARGRAVAEDRNAPVVINSDGWVSGTGADLLAYVAQCAAPSHVVSMTFANSREKASLTEALQLVSMDRAFELESPLTGRHLSFSGGSLRDLQMAAYFCKELDEGSVREAGIELLQIACIGEDIENISLSTRFSILNGCVVALADTCGSSKHEQWDVRGFGLVRAVDTTRETLFIVTPLPTAALEQCDGIIVSSGIQLPAAVYLGMAERAVPWIKPPYIEPHVVATAGRMKSRASLVRRYTKG